MKSATTVTAQTFTTKTFAVKTFAAKTLVAALAALFFATGCGSLPGNTAQGSAPEQTTLLAIRSDIKSGLRFQRTVLGNTELKAGIDRDTLAQVAGRYRQLAEKVVSRSRPLPALRGFAAGMDEVVAYERATLAGKPAAAAALAAVVGEYQGAFSRAAADADARLGRRAPGEGEDDLLWNPHVGKAAK